MSEGVDEYLGGYVFKLSETDWNPSVLFGFTRNKTGVFADGYAPNSTPVFDKTGNLSGTTYLSKNVTTGGTAFRLTPKGKSWEIKLLHTFTGKKGDGVYPLGPLTVDSSGNVYGTTYRRRQSSLQRQWGLCRLWHSLRTESERHYLHRNCSLEI